MRRDYVALYATICTSEKLADLASDTNRLFYTWLLPQCDAWGRADGRARVLNAKVWPMLSKSLKETESALADCISHHLLHPYHHAELVWVQIPDWEEKAGRLCKNGRRGSSAYPEPTPEYSGVLLQRVSHLRSTPLRGEERREEEKNPPTPQGGRRAPRAAATGPQAEVIRHWIQEWARTRLGAEWKIAPRDCAHFSALLTQWDVREVCDRITRLLDSADSFHLRAASPGILEQNFNQLAVEVRVAPKFTSITDQNLQNLEEARRIVAAKSNESEYLL